MNTLSCQLNIPQAEEGLLEKSGEHLFSSGPGCTCGFNLSSGSLRDEKRGDRTILCTLLSSPGWLMVGKWIIFILSNFIEYSSRASELFCWQVVLVSWGVKMLRAAFQSKRSHRLAERIDWREPQRTDWREPKQFAWGWDTGLREVTLHSSTSARRRSWPFFLSV